MDEYKLLEDLSTLTTISESTFDKLNDKIIWCISDCVEKSMFEREPVSKIDIGIGKLLISTSNNEVKYKFIPSKQLEASVSNTVVNERNDLVLNIEESLVSKMQNTFKNFF